MTRRHGAAVSAAFATVAALVLSGCAGAGGTAGAGEGSPSGSPDSRWKVRADRLTGVPTPYGSPPSATPRPPASDGALPSAAPSPVPMACPDSGVAVITGVVNAAMGRRATTVRLTNCGQEPYHVDGYPQIGALDEDRDPLKLTITHGAYTDSIGDQGPKSLTLAPGESVESVLNWTNGVTSFDPVRQGEYLVVAPARGEKGQTVPFFLDIGTSAELDVTAWARPRTP